MMDRGYSVSAVANRRVVRLPVGAAIKELRKAKGWTAAELGERRGVGAQAVYAIEGDTGNPRLDTVEGYIEALEVTPRQYVAALDEALRRRQAMKNLLDIDD